MNSIKKVLLFIILFSVDATAQDSLNAGKKKQLANLIDNIRKPGFSAIDLFNFERKYFDKQMKTRLLEVISNKWTEEELVLWAKKDINGNFYKNFRESNAQRLSKKYNTDYKKNLDSIENRQIQEIKDSYKQERIDNNLILSVAWLDMQEAIPVLKNALQNTKQYNSEKVRLSLARLKVEPYYSEAIKFYSAKQRNQYGDFETNPIYDYYQRSRSLLFICTIESVEVASQWLKVTKKVNMISDGERMTSIANFAVIDLSEMILNKDFRKICYPEKFQETADAVKPKELEFCKNWILVNKNKMILNREKAFFIGFLN
jgi:predicted transposase YbfD/YdcC